jgi:transposase
MLRNVWLAVSQEQKGRAVNPRTRKAANAATNDETRTTQQVQTKEPQGGDHDAPRAHYVIGLDLSDRTAHYAVLGPAGEDWRAEKKIQLNRESLRRYLAEYAGSLLVMEVGAHSRWVQPVIEELGLDVFVAHAASIPGITRSVNKHDRADARQLARLGRADCGLLRRTHHRSDATQSDLLLIRARAALVKSRSSLIVCARGLLKSFGERVSGGSKSFADLALESIPPHLRSALTGLLEAINSLTEQILAYDKQIEEAATRYPVVERMRTIPCVGTLTALSFFLTVEDPQRLTRSRLAGCFCGLRPKRSQSGERDPQLGIAKTGDGYLRTLLVQCAHHLLGWSGQDCALRQWGLAVEARGGSGAKKRAIIAVARKLAVLLHRLWTSGQTFIPFPAGLPAVPAE